jgi:DNA-directed RNA polymerase sigma subunit (sigma70/sigma32)
MGAQSRRHDDGDLESPDLIEDDEDVLQDLVRQARLAQPLRPGEEEMLLQRSALGDRPSQDRLVAANLAMVVRLASTRGDQGLSALDLVQEVSIGLLEAVRSFVDSGEADFARFAELRVGAQMDAAIASEAVAVRDTQLLVAAATDYEHTEVVLRHELGREPTEHELAEKLEWTPDRTRYVARVVADARRQRDEELLAFIDPQLINFDDDDERAEFDT